MATAMVEKGAISTDRVLVTEKNGKKKISNDVTSYGGHGNNDKNSDHTKAGYLIKVYIITVAVNRVTFTVFSRMVFSKY
jgi:hypothetical protein